jgi:hydrogenase maturation protease
MKTDPPKPILVAACGNLLAGDDAFGPLVLHTLDALWSHDDPIRRDVEVLDLSIAPAALLDHLPGRFALVLVDAVHVSRDVGDLIDVSCSDPAELPLLVESTCSSHGMGLDWQLKLAAELHLLPSHARLLALPITPARAGDRLSPRTADQLHRAARAADRLCRAFASLWRRGAQPAESVPTGPPNDAPDGLAADRAPR